MKDIALKLIALSIVVSFISYSAGVIVTSKHYSEKLGELSQSEVMARCAIVELNRANNYLMQGDNDTAYLFLLSASGFIYRLHWEYDIISNGYQKIIQKVTENLLQVMMYIKYGFNETYISNFTEKINVTIGMLMPFSDIIRYKNECEEFKKLFEKYEKYVYADFKKKKNKIVVGCKEE